MRGKFMAVGAFFVMGVASGLEALGSGSVFFGLFSLGCFGALGVYGYFAMSAPP